MNTRPLKDPVCPDHSKNEPIIAPSGNSYHAARLVCPVCNRHLKWLPKSDSRLKNLVFIPTPPPTHGQLQLFDPPPPAPPKLTDRR